MSLQTWFRSPRRFLVSFLAVTMLPAAALFWLGWRFLEQDRALETQRMRERREQAIDLIVTALEQALAADEQRTETLAGSEDALVLVFEDDRIETRPKNRLLYYPVVPAGKEAPTEVFARGEELEFRRQDYDGAITAFRELARSGDVMIRAGACLRLARNLRKAGKAEQALEEYEKLARCGAVPLSGIPAELVARRARLELLAELNRLAESRREAEALASDLDGGHWQLDRATCLNNLRAAGHEPPQEASAFAAAAEWLWNKRKETPSGRESVTMEGRSITLLWRGASALVAGSRYREQHWLRPLAPLLKSQGVRLSLTGTPSPSQTQRAASTTGLPWTLAVSSADPAADMRQFAARRGFLLAMAGILGALVCAGSYMIARAVNRELAVARVQSDFVSAVSHEFRTPLTLLRQITEIFTEGRVTDEAEKKSYYQAQGRATERLQRLVESLLDFGRMEAGAKAYRLQPLDAAQLVREVVEEFQREAAGGYEVELSIEKATAAVKGDPDALTHAVWNLLDNAVKYSPECRKVWVQVGGQGDQLSIAVRDRGLGIPKDEQEQIFRKFVRGAASRVNGIRGTGIGLAMVAHIVQAHGGAVRLESAPGAGSTFTILLPAMS